LSDNKQNRKNFGLNKTDYKEKLKECLEKLKNEKENIYENRNRGIDLPQGIQRDKSNPGNREACPSPPEKCELKFSDETYWLFPVVVLI